MRHKINGLHWALATALISGFSIFLNSFAVKFSQGPEVFATSKNVLVAIFLISILIGTKNFTKLKNLKRGDWLYLILIGLVGGSIPFLLFFKGLALTGADTASFIHKTLFIGVAIGAIIFLKEKITFWSAAGLILLVGGNLILFKTPSSFWGDGQRLIWLAVGFWTLENLILKKFFLTRTQIPSIVTGWGRMFFGAIFMLIYLGFTGKLNGLGQFSATQLWWILATSVLLLGYVATWYEAVKRAPVHIVTSILVLGSPITTLLTAIFIKHQWLTWRQTEAIIIFVLAAVCLISSRRLTDLAHTKPSDHGKNY